MSSPSAVDLVVLDVDAAELRRQVLDLAPREDQLAYSGRATDTLPDADADPFRTPFAVVQAGVAVGFGVLDRSPLLLALLPVDVAHTVLLRAFYLDARAQGRGLGRDAISRIPDLVRHLWPDVVHLTLTVNVTNVRAREAYLAAGFRDVGERYTADRPDRSTSSITRSTRRVGRQPAQREVHPMSDAAAPGARSVLTNGAASTPTQVVRRFLERLADKDLDGALDLVDEDILYTNVSLPSVRGKQRVRRVLGGLDRPSAGFEVFFHSIAADDGSVLTERTDAITLGRVRLQFWAWGRFDVVDGKITIWRDSFDWSDIARATVRGLVGAVVPAFRPRAPSDPTNQVPGR